MVTKANVPAATESGSVMFQLGPRSENVDFCEGQKKGFAGNRVQDGMKAFERMA